MIFTNRIRALAAAGAQLLANVHTLVVDGFRYLSTCLRPNAAIVAENLFLRKQLTPYQERQAKPRRANNITRLILVWMSRCFDWKSALQIVQPQTFVRWHPGNRGQALPVSIIR